MGLNVVYLLSITDVKTKTVQNMRALLSMLITVGELYPSPG